MALITTLMLLLLAWHFTIQEAAHQKATQEVQTWLESMGAQASKIHFRMLRGTLSISHIKVDVSGHDLLIQSLMIKGNLASLTSHKPLLHQVVIRQASWQRQDGAKLWQTQHVKLPPSLQTIFRHAKHIRILQSSIQNETSEEAIYIHHIDVSGPIENRVLRGQGYIQQQPQTWVLEAHFPIDFKQQTGQFSYTLQDVLHQVDWSGAWSQQNMQVHIVQTDLTAITAYPEQTASLDIRLLQQDTAWQGEVQAHLWLIDNPDISSRISGQAKVQGDIDDWIWRSEQLIAVDTTFKKHQSSIQNITFEQLHIDTKLRQFKAAKTTLNQVQLSLNVQDVLSRKTTWQVDLKNVVVQGLNTQLQLAEGQVNVIDLAGTARISPTSMYIDVQSQQGDASWHIYHQGVASLLYVRAKHVPLLQIRALLPAPIAHKATTLQGETSLRLQLQPWHDWQVKGKASISNMLLAWDSQQFSAKDVTLRLQQANRLGHVQVSSLQIKQWDLLLPLTPRQAWTTSSNLDDWLGLSWNIQRANLRDGSIALGQPEQVWFEQVQLQLQSWQSTTPATLDLSAVFGLSPLQLHMQLQSKDGKMVWQDLSMRSKHANLFALSDWLTLSGFAGIEKGHGSLLLQAKQDSAGIVGKVNASFNQLTFEDGQAEQDYLSAQLAYPMQRYAEQAKYGKLGLNTAFQGESNWSLLAGQALLQQLKDQRPTSTAKRKKSLQRTHLSSISLHEKRKFSHNERLRLRDIAAQFKAMRGVRLELVPDLGTAELSPLLQQHITQTQQQIVTFLAQQGIQTRLMYPVRAQAKHRSTGSAGAIHLYAVQ
ncbi:MAG: hypothetical protein Q9M19_00215 [Mariprofundaceae bacterium]|nr:hypothetical protein [Mariprofundaceae bacterium]